MTQLTESEQQIIATAQRDFRALLAKGGISLQVRRDFREYTAIRRRHGDSHLNQAFDPQHVKFGADDFWLLATNAADEAVATYCLRRLFVDDFFKLIRSQQLWFCRRRRSADPRFVVGCEIPPFGGEVVHGGGLWIRGDYRGASRLAVIMPHFARAFALDRRPFDHDSAMIRNDPGDPAEAATRKATYMGRRVYGFARVHPFVDGWFPPERRRAIMFLCHSTRAEAMASLFATPSGCQRLERGREFRKLPLVDQYDEPVYPPPVLSQGQQQARV
jgi:hypothetical protein